LGHSGVRQTQNNNALVPIRWISPHISEIQVPSEKCRASISGTRGNLFIGSRSQPNISCELHLVPEFLAHVDCRPRQVSVDQKTHAELGCWQWVKRLLLSQFTHKSERSPDVVGRDVVLTLYVLECHTPGQAADNHRYRQASAPNDGFAVTDGGVDDNAVRGGHGESDDSDLAELVEFGLPQR